MSDMHKIIIIILIIALGLSIYGNFYLIVDNFDLYKQINDISLKNSELSNQIITLTTNVNNLETKLSESSNIILSETKSKLMETNSQSITAVSVRPVLIRDGFFQNIHYEGTVMNIELSIHEGTGLVLVNTAIPTGVDFQSSAKIAVNVAEKYLQTDLSNTDIIFSITSDENKNLQAVDGQSAGAAMTVLLISSLQNKQLKDDVIITGTITSDMNIGMVGGIYEKADAAGRYGASVFLVPSKQGITFVEKCNESKTGNFVYRSCSSEQKPLSPITEERYGMKTIEVDNIKNALLYFQ